VQGQDRKSLGDRFESYQPLRNRLAVFRQAMSVTCLLVTTAVAVGVPNLAWAETQSQQQSATEARVQAMVPDLESYIARGMRSFDVPGLAIGIVADDRLVYARGFGTRSRPNGAPVDPATVFQIGSLTKAFLSATLAIAVDRGWLHWDDRVTDLDPGFQMSDPWVTREFRVFDLLAQRSGLPPAANDGLELLGLDETALVRSLRYVEPVSSFRTTFAYTNITHMLAGRLVAKASGAAQWNEVLQKELLDSLGMANSSYTAAAIAAAPDHAEGYRWTPQGAVPEPFTPIVPYGFAGADDINSDVEDLARWLRMQLSDGALAGKRIVSAENLLVTHTPRIAITDRVVYAMGWFVQQTPNGGIIWHNGTTPGFGAFLGMAPDRKTGVIVLSNQGNVGLPDSIGAWVLDRVLGSAKTDYLAERLEQAKTNLAAAEEQYAKPAKPGPSPPYATIAGDYVNPGFGDAAVRIDGDALVLELPATGAKLKLDPWDGNIFTATLMPSGPFAAVVAGLGPSPYGFVQWQIDKTAKLDTFRLILGGDQAYEFRRR
jgi:CubicO group peptidase (beta-lactamase class C family)